MYYKTPATKSLPGLWSLAMLAVIGGFSLNSVYAQGVSDTEIDPSDSQIPAAPTVTAESCGNGCISVGVSGFRFTDGTTTAYTKRNWHYVEGCQSTLAARQRDCHAGEAPAIRSNVWTLQMTAK